MYRVLLFFSVINCLVVTSTRAGEYDPLTIDKQSPQKSINLTVKDSARQRDIPLKVYLPKVAQPQPVVLFSHGLGGSREGCSYLGRHWAARGYVAVFLQHPGSDESVWKNVGIRERMQAMQAAASGRNFQLRVKDVSIVLDQLAVWNAADNHPLKGRLNLKRVGMSGHSFGAQTTQAVSGQSFSFLGPRLTDSRIRAAVIFSPGTPRRGSAQTAFGQVKRPWMLMTGTNDTAPIGGQTVEGRLAVYPALPPGGKYELVLHEAEHSAFTDRKALGDKRPRNPNHHRAILALSTAFWDTYLREDQTAKTWLHSDKPKEILQPRDRWQKK